MSLRKYFMHLTHQTYEELGEGIVRVTDRNGRTGVFHWTGPWIEGELRECNINMLSFTGGPNIPKEFNYRWPEVPADTKRTSGWPEKLERYLTSVGTL